MEKWQHAHENRHLWGPQIQVNGESWFQSYPATTFTLWQMTLSFLPTRTVLLDLITLRLVQFKAGPSVRLCLLNFTVLSLDAAQCFYFMFASLAEPAINYRSAAFCDLMY